MIVILDAGSQYGKLIEKKIKNLGVYTMIKPFDTEPLSLIKYQGIIISGSPIDLIENDVLPHQFP